MPYIEVKLEDIVFDPIVQAYCNNPKFRCPNYNHSWCCPPNAPYLEDKVSEFKKLFIIYFQFDLKFYIKEVKAKHPKRSESRILNSLYRKNLVRDYLEQEIFEFFNEYKEKYDEKLVLWDGFCRVCYNEKDKCCTYDSGEPCRYPDRKRYSMEAVGIHVTNTVKNLNFDIEWPPVNHYYRFGLVCLK